MKGTEVGQNDAQNSYKKVIDSDVPLEDMLGSVTAYNNVEGSQQLRTSARVFKKMKLDSDKSTSSQTAQEKKPEPVKEEPKQPETKKFRPLWTQEDKDFFFEALNEYGKDFESIHSYISAKLRKKGMPESQIKSKDQIRHFYYRSWHKISKHLKFSEDIKKPVQELYSLINYGELRKKIGFVTEKTTVKLNEMIYMGSVAIRVKGKTLRIRTPMCKALRKLNQLDEKHEDLKLPTRVTIELKPKNMHTFAKVQETAQNPRVRIVLPLQKRLSSIIKHMTERWKSKVAKEYEKTTNTISPIISDCVPLEEFPANINILSPPLRLTPPEDTHINLPSFNLSEYLTSQSICLNAYEEKIGVKVPGQELFQIMCTSNSKNNAKKSQKRPRNESTSDKVSPTAKKETDQVTTTSNTDVAFLDVDEAIDIAVNELLALQNVTENTDKKENNHDVKSEVITPEMKIEGVRRGWTGENSENVSIGDLYLMFGSDSRLVLEYSWDDSSKVKKETEVPINENASQELQEEEQEINASLECEKTPLSTILKRLLSLAKLHYRKNIVKCPCGHVCGTTGSIVTTPKNTAIKIVKEEVQDTNKGNSTLKTVVAETYVANQPSVIYQTQVTTTPFFRRPTSPNSALHAQLASIRRLKPKYCNRRGRFRRNQQVAVERKLPILANKADINSSGRIVQMNIIPQANITSQNLRQIAPKVVDITSNITSAGEVKTLVNTEYVNGTVSVVNLQQANATSYSILNVNEVNNINIVASTSSESNNGIHMSDNATTVSRVGSPTSISNLLDMALAPMQNRDVILNDMQHCATPIEISFAGLLPDSGSTPPSSPSRILKENDNQWLNSEVNDFSLSSFLGHLESPMKVSQGPPLNSDDTRMGLSQDMDQHLQSLLTESSLDYTAKFADLAAQVSKK